MDGIGGEEIKLAIQILMGVCLFVSELLPFIGSHDYNGILHFIAKKMKLCGGTGDCDRDLAGAGSAVKR